MKTEDEILGSKTYLATIKDEQKLVIVYNDAKLAMQEYSDQQTKELQEQLAAKDKELSEVKAKLSNNCTCTESITCDQCLSN